MASTLLSTHRDQAMFAAGHQKFGGRRKGTSNRRTALIRQFLARGYSPLEALAAIAEDPKTPLAVRLKINLELLAYCYPRFGARVLRYSRVARPGRVIG